MELTLEQYKELYIKEAKAHGSTMHKLQIKEYEIKKLKNDILADKGYQIEAFKFAITEPIQKYMNGDKRLVNAINEILDNTDWGITRTAILDMGEPNEITYMLLKRKGA